MGVSRNPLTCRDGHCENLEDLSNEEVMEQFDVARGQTTAVRGFSLWVTYGNRKPLTPTLSPNGAKWGEGAPPRLLHHCASISSKRALASRRRTAWQQSGAARPSS